MNMGDHHILPSNDDCDAEMTDMKDQLNEFGLDEENLSKEEMRNLLKALNDSKTTAKEDELLRHKVEDMGNGAASPSKTMKRRYLNVRDRRMPWSVLPSSITQVEKARTLAVYIKMMAINSYRRARQSVVFAAWPPPIQIVEETTRIQPLRSTRSGRSVPMYAGFDDDSSDLDVFITKAKKKKISHNDDCTDGVYSNKVLSLKRKSSKEDNVRPTKEMKTNDDAIEFESFVLGNNLKPKTSLFTFDE